MNTPSIDARQLKAMLGDGNELALIDVREAGQFGESHLLFATSIPYSRLESDVIRLAPRRTVRMVLCDDGDSGIAAIAARRLASLGYSDVAVLKEGTRGWKDAGFVLYAGVNVPSKTFGEMVEHAYHTPRISCEELRRLREAGEDVVVLDGRPWDEYRKMTIPGSTCCPNAELPLRISSLVRNASTSIVVNCAGRTRSILGAQTLINFGVPNPVYALENGIQGWVLSGGEPEYGAQRKYPERLDKANLPAQQAIARGLMQQFSIASATAAEVQSWLGEAGRTTFLLDVRTPEEYGAGSLPGAVHAPGGQLIQAIESWVGVRNARIVLFDDENVRAPVVASWLKQLGCDVYVLADGVRASVRAAVPTLPVPPHLHRIIPAELKTAIDASSCAVIDLRPSMSFRKARIPGSVWSIRPRVAETAAKAGKSIVLVAEHAAAAALAAIDLREAGCTDLELLDGGVDAWTKAGYPTTASPDTPCDADCIDYLFFVHDRHAGNLNAMKQYLAWETGLLAQLDEQERNSFRVRSPHHDATHVSSPSHRTP